MANLQKVLKVTQAQYNTLAAGGTVGSYTGLNSNYVYLVTDNTNYVVLDDSGNLNMESGNIILCEGVLQINSDNSTTYTGDDWDSFIYADRIQIFNNDTSTTAEFRFPDKGTGTYVFATISDLSGYATQSWVTQQGYLTSVSWSQVTDKPTFATVATSGSYNDLTNKPTIPTVNNSTITIYNGYNTESSIASFTLNQANNQTINLPLIPSKASDVNDYGEKYVNPKQVRDYQTIFGIAPTLLTNINGHSISSVYNTVDVTVDGYPAVKIRKNDGNANLTFDESHNYMRKITGSNFTPTFGDGTVPQYSYIVGGDGTLYKPQWDNTNGLLLYKVNRLAMYSDIPSVLSTGASNKDKYLHTNASTGALEWAEAGGSDVDYSYNSTTGILTITVN